VKISNTMRRQKTQFATIKSPIDAVKFSNTLQLSPKYSPIVRTKLLCFLKAHCFVLEKKTESTLSE
jgi:hypothetical protein